MIEMFQHVTVTPMVQSSEVSVTGTLIHHMDLKLEGVHVSVLWMARDVIHVKMDTGT